jgi:AcrR family transcriptional regulator
MMLRGVPMKRAKKAVQPPAAARRNAAPGANGRARIDTILAAARNVLIEKYYKHFTLRNVAAAAGIYLANLQYYFPSRDALLHALLDYIVQHYNDVAAECVANLPDLPYPRFVAMVDSLIADIRDPRTRRLFIQLWALLESCDKTGDATLLNSFSAPYLTRLAGCIAELNPGLSPGERRQRAAMIGAMIDGMMVMLLEADTELAPGQPEIGAEMRRQILRIAMDP